MNKYRKGRWFLENFASVALAAVGFVLIVILGVQLVNFFISEDKNAQKVIDNIMGKVDTLKDGESNTFLIQSTDGLFLVGWSKGEEGRPDKCFLESCLCVCPNANKDSCQENGICRDIDKKETDIFSIVSEGSIDQQPLHKFDSPRVFIITKEIKLYCIKLDNKLFPFNISKQIDSLAISIMPEGDQGKFKEGYRCIR